ncbi:MAG TPA: hypothetical protein DIU39_10705 [Flavobacteriales bacterium]|nr:hypothetical protein [Flavobacteriales bacterium]|tara:strand:+ start:12499 stop:13911 length:1413 start_codon:yes stop_codon:yes gene_type:complete
MKKITLNLILLLAINIIANAQLTIDSVSVVKTCLSCDSIGSNPPPSPYGSLYIEVSGGVAPYSFSLTGMHPANSTPLTTTSNNGTTGFYNSLCQDTFTLVINDANNNTLSYTFNTYPPTPPTLSIDSITVKPDSTNNPNSGYIEFHVTTNADSVFYMIQDVNNSLNLGSLGGWQQTPVFDSLPGGYYYNLYVDIYPKVYPNCNNGIDSGATFFQVYVPLACENTGFADFFYNDVCLYQSVNFLDNSYAGDGAGNNIVSWYWDFGDGMIDVSPTPLPHTYSSPGVYNVTLVVQTSHGCTFGQVHQVTVHEIPNSSFSYQDNGSGQFTFNDLSTVNNGVIASWYWDFGDGTTSTSQNPVHQYASTGSYFVCLLTTSSFGCADTICQNVSFITGVNDLNDYSKIKIQPNPTQNYITVPNVAYNQLIIYDVTGKEIEKFNQNTSVVDVKEYKPGVYFVKLITANRVYDLKFLKE